MRQILLFVALFLPICAFSQFTESFSGSSLTSANPWEGDVDAFELNAEEQLQFISPKGRSGTAVLSVPVRMNENMTWDISAKLDFKSTASNCLQVYVYSDEDFKVYIQAGTNKGEVSLYLNNGSKSPKRLIKSEEGLLFKEPYDFIHIRLTLENGSLWTLYTKTNVDAPYKEQGSSDTYLGDLANMCLFSLHMKYVQARVSSYYVDHIKIEHGKNEYEENGYSDVQLLDVQQVNSYKLQFIFDGFVDIQQASCFIDGVGEIDQIKYGDNRSIVEIYLSDPLQEEQSYFITWENIYDAEGKPLENFSLEVFFEDDIPSPSDPPQPGTFKVEPGDIVFNELLPNPFVGGSEYIELYNRSARSVTLQGLAVAVRKGDGTLGPVYPLGNGTLEKEGYALLTKDIAGVTVWYSIYSSEVLHEVKLPVLANTSSTLVLLRTEDMVVIDEVSYSSKWHSSSVKNQKGVALERMDPDKNTQDAANWTSATSLCGYGTPGYKNSQYGKKSETNDDIHIGTPVHTEEGFYSIDYALNSSGYSCRAYIYNMSGNRVGEIANNELLGLSGQLIWYGKSLKGTRLQAGVYILIVELYNVKSGGKKHIKKAFLVK